MNDLWKYLPSSASPLPVTLVSFNGSLQGEKVTLHWTVLNEQDFDRYEVERSFNNTSFSKIGEVKAINADRYSYIDNFKESGGNKLYYRLKKIDKDAKFSYSSIVVVKIPLEPLFRIYPNPVTTSSKLFIDADFRGKTTIEITDINGKALIRNSYDVNNSVIVISTNSLAAGTYFIKVCFGDKQYSQKVTVLN